MLYWQSFKVGLNRLFQLPAFCLPIILSLGLTLAAVLTALAIYHALLIRPLPQIQAPEQLSLHQPQLKMGSMTVNIINKPMFLNFRNFMQAYGEWAYLAVHTQTMVQIAEQSHEFTMLEASAGTPELLGLSLLAGDSSQFADDQSGVWISESVWQRFYQSEQAIVGKMLTYQGQHYKIAGVYKDVTAVPATPSPSGLQFWRFFDGKAQLSADANSFGSSAKLILRGVQQPDEAALTKWRQQAEQQFPVLSMLASQGAIENFQQDYRAAILGDSVKLIWLLLAVTFSALLIAALNLTNLLLAHYQRRQPEFAIQMLSGCTVVRLKLLVAIENLALIIPALLVGAIGSLWLIKSLPLWAGNNLPLLSSISLDYTVVLMLGALGVGLLGLFSIPVAAPKQLTIAVNSSGKGLATQQSAWLVNSLFLGQLVLSTIIICGAALLAYQGYRQIYTDYGFELVNSYLVDSNPEQEHTTSDLLSSTSADYLQYQQRNELLQQKILQHWPEALVSNSRQQPIESSVTIGSLHDGQSNIKLSTQLALVDNAYFSIFGIKLLHGSLFSADSASQQIIIDLPTAKAFSAANPAQLIGRQLNGKQVVGIVAPVKSHNNMATSYYFSQTPAAQSQRLLVVLPKGQSLSVAALTAAFAELAPEYPKMTVQSLQQNWLDSTKQTRLHFYLILLITATCLLLAVLGIAGVSQQQSRQKRYELAIRLATGASQQQLLWFVSARSGLLLLLGLMLGAGLTMLIAHYLSGHFSLLKDLNWQHLLVLQSGYFIVAFMAMLIPCAQVIRRDPLQSLRQP